MKINKYMRIFICILVFIMLTPVYSFAAGEIDLEQSSAITIYYHADGVPITGAKFSLYKIASVNEKGIFTLENDFKNLNIILNGKDTAWKDAAITLESHIAKNNIKPLVSKLIDSNGYAYFMDGERAIPKGLYLISGNIHNIGDIYYEAEPVLVALPTRNATSNMWMYDIIVNLKFDFFSLDGEGHITRKVLKVWDNADTGKKNPKEITVHLLKDREVYDTVVLNDDNNWRYSWSGLDAVHKWTVYEEPVEDYTVEITREGVTYVVKNTYVPEIPEPTPTPIPPQDNNEDSFGQLWWPVPLLATSGLVLIILGMAQRKGYADE